MSPIIRRLRDRDRRLEAVVGLDAVPEAEGGRDRLRPPGAPDEAPALAGWIGAPGGFALEERGR